MSAPSDFALSFAEQTFLQYDRLASKAIREVLQTEAQILAAARALDYEQLPVLARRLRSCEVRRDTAQDMLSDSLQKLRELRATRPETPESRDS